MIELLLTVLFGMALGTGLVWLFFRHLRQKLEAAFKEKYSETFQQTMIDLETGNLVPLTVEVDGEWYLCYNAVSNDFVCQGRDLKEICERFSLRFPNKSAAIYNGDEQAVQHLKQQLKDQNEDISSIRRTS